MGDTWPERDRYPSKPETETNVHYQIVAVLAGVPDEQVADVEADNGIAGWKEFKSSTDIQGKMISGGETSGCKIQDIAAGATYEFIAKFDKPWPDFSEKARTVCACSNLNAKQAQCLLALSEPVLGEIIDLCFKGQHFGYIDSEPPPYPRIPIAGVQKGELPSRFEAGQI
jgi:hypothetical protein